MKIRFVVLLVVVGLVMSACSPVGMGTFDSPLPGPVPQPGDTELLEGLLTQLISGGLASILVYAFLAQNIGKALVDVLVTGLNALRISMEWAEVARYTAIVLSGVLSMGAYLVAMAFGFVPNPGDAAAWINLALWLLGVGFTGSQVLHARLSARKA